MILIFNIHKIFFVTHSTDGITWDTATEIQGMKNDNTIGIIKWSNTGVKVQEDLNMLFYFCVYDNRGIKVVSGGKTILATCYSSFDQGRSWQTIVLEAQNVNASTKNVKQAFYYDGFVYLVTVLKNDNVTQELYRCYVILNNKLQCIVRNYSVVKFDNEDSMVNAFFVVRDYLFVTTIHVGKMY